MEQACSKCGEVKSLEEFYAQQGGKHGRSKQCKACKSKRGKDRYAEPANKQRQIERQLARYHANPKPWIEAVVRYKDKHPDLYRKSNADRRARILGQFLESVDPEIVYRMHGGMCGICKGFVAADNFHVDHVIPLARGGRHGYVNVQPAHPACNQRKWAN